MEMEWLGIQVETGEVGEGSSIAWVTWRESEVERVLREGVWWCSGDGLWWR